MTVSKISFDCESESGFRDVCAVGLEKHFREVVRNGWRKWWEALCLNDMRN
jgi:hypothetical protein